MINTVDDLLEGRDFKEFYQGLSPEQRNAVEKQVFEVGHDLWTCHDWGINYARPDSTQLRAVACYELGLLE